MSTTLTCCALLLVCSSASASADPPPLPTYLPPATIAHTYLCLYSYAAHVDTCTTSPTHLLTLSLSLILLRLATYTSASATHSNLLAGGRLIIVIDPEQYFYHLE
mmetsp:Transcript_15517/g.23471  ORF Transcript_15517/g.23471 Transcript_15517/m.23471 type:complete len:105 (-) Transcript_15517:430-744(-)